jgi:hypothetical protein
MQNMTPIGNLKVDYLREFEVELKKGFSPGIRGPGGIVL